MDLNQYVIQYMNLGGGGNGIMDDDIIWLMAIVSSLCVVAIFTDTDK